MATTDIRLTDTHLIILDHASRHPKGRVLPVPDGVGNKGGTATRALKSLMQRKLIEQCLAGPEDQEWARAENGQRLTLTITPAGRAAIAAADSADQPTDVAVDNRMTAPSVTTEASFEPDGEGAAGGRSTRTLFRAGTKGAVIVAMLRSNSGATLSDLMAASGWQKHSVRGFLSGTLKKKHGLIVASEKVDDIRRYRIAA
jgi:hypothetical protein